MLAIRQKGASQNGCYKKIKCAKFSFFEKLDGLCFLVWGSPFCFTTFDSCRAYEKFLVEKGCEHEFSLNKQESCYGAFKSQSCNFRRAPERFFHFIKIIKHHGLKQGKVYETVGFPLFSEITYIILNIYLPQAVYVTITIKIICFTGNDSQAPSKIKSDVRFPVWETSVIARTDLLK